MPTSPSPKTKHCRVCGDFALSFNFNGLCCEPCKGFFRRNVAKIDKLRCIYNGTCQIDKNNRKICQRCRLEKCLAIGMKLNVVKSIEKYSSNFTTEIENHRISHYAYEQAKIAEVQDAMSVFGDVSSFEPVGQVGTILQAVNLAELFIERSVKFCLKILSFSALKQSDQLVLLKSSHSEIAPVFVAFLYDRTRDRFPVVTDVERNTAIWINSDISQQLKHKDFGQQFRNFANAMQDEMENDTAIRDLIMAQLLFKPRDNLSCPEYIRYNHLFYCHLLRRYLEHKYVNTSLAKQKFCSITSILSQMSRVSEMIREVYTSEIESSKVAQVIAEIYNLL